jgi:bud site selection protein 20
MGNAPGKRKVGGNSKTRKWHKQQLRGKFEERHVDQVWEDVRKAPHLVHNGKTGPQGTAAKWVGCETGWGSSGEGKG